MIDGNVVFVAILLTVGGLFLRFMSDNEGIERLKDQLHSERQTTQRLRRQLAEFTQAYEDLRADNFRRNLQKYDLGLQNQDPPPSKILDVPSNSGGDNANHGG